MIMMMILKLHGLSLKEDSRVADHTFWSSTFLAAGSFMVVQFRQTKSVEGFLRFQEFLLRKCPVKIVL